MATQAQEHHPTHALRAAMRDLTARVTQRRGALTPAQRRGIIALAAATGASTPPMEAATALPAPLAALAETIARHAYRVTDETINQLLAAGYTQDAIFETIISAAMGAGTARMEHGLAALAGAPLAEAPVTPRNAAGK